MLLQDWSVHVQNGVHCQTTAACIILRFTLLIQTAPPESCMFNDSMNKKIEKDDIKSATIFYFMIIKIIHITI